MHYRRAAILECEEQSCGGSRTNPATADYGRELRDELVAKCGESCPAAWLDAKRAGTVK